MNEKIYYGQRNNYVDEIKLYLNKALRLFKNKIDLLIDELYFLKLWDIIVQMKVEF